MVDSTLPIAGGLGLIPGQELDPSATTKDPACPNEDLQPKEIKKKKNAPQEFKKEGVWVNEFVK